MDLGGGAVGCGEPMAGTQWEGSKCSSWVGRRRHGGQKLLKTLEPEAAGVWTRTVPQVQAGGSKRKCY